VLVSMPDTHPLLHYHCTTILASHRVSHRVHLLASLKHSTEYSCQLAGCEFENRRNSPEMIDSVVYLSLWPLGKQIITRPCMARIRTISVYIGLIRAPGTMGIVNTTLHMKVTIVSLSHSSTSSTALLWGKYHMVPLFT
jgi:hypothetical protein